MGNTATDRPRTLVNMTAHPVRLTTTDGHLAELPPTLPTPRVEVPDPAWDTLPTQAGTFPLRQHTNAAPTIIDLPDQQDGVLLVVSRAVALVVHNRNDLVVPDDQQRGADNLVTRANSLTTYGSR